MFEKLKDPHIQEMAKMILRQALQFIGGALVATGAVKAGTYTAVIEQYESIFGAVIALATAAWMVSRNTKAAITANVDQYPEVKGVITTNTPEGAALALAVPSATVVTAGDANAAQAVASPTVPAKDLHK